MIAIVTVRRDPSYRRDALIRGLSRAGYRVVDKGRPESKGDLLVMWNRQGAAESNAETWEQTGGSVLVCENGYFGKDKLGRQFYALAIHGHNGSGWFPVGDEDRFAALGVEPQPWRVYGGPILVCGQRGIGSREMKSPPHWETRTAQRVKAMNLKVRLRRHPGLIPSPTTLDQDLSDASACLLWSSTSGVRALLQGVPVVYAAPHWICSSAATAWQFGLDKLLRDDAARLAALRRMAWAQRSVDEIESGEVFVRMRERISEATW